MTGPGRLRVLVADDGEEWRYILTRLLEAEYKIVGYAERGDELIGIASDLHPDVITLDVSMPGQSGLMALPALRSALPEAIIVVVSTTASPLYQKEAYARGADAYVAKNRVLPDLLWAISCAKLRFAERQSRRA